MNNQETKHTDNTK